MKKILLLLAGIVIITFSGISQNQIDSTAKMMNEQIVLDINWLSWMNYPSNIKLKPTSAEFILSYLHPLFGKKKHFSMAAGLGLSSQNIKYNAYISSLNDKPIFITFNDSIKFNMNKLATVFVDVPLEFRLRTKNNIHQKNFKFTFGGKIGYMLKSYHKYSGDEYRCLNTGTTTKFKEYNIPYLNKLHYGVFAKVFYGKLGLNINYSLSTLFEKKFTPDIVPISVGLTMIFI